MGHARDGIQPPDGCGHYRVNEPGMDWAYGDVCLVVRVGKAGDRLAYRTVAQLERAYEKSDRRDELRYTYYYGRTIPEQYNPG